MENGNSKRKSVADLLPFMEAFSSGETILYDGKVVDSVELTMDPSLLFILKTPDPEPYDQHNASSAIGRIIRLKSHSKVVRQIVGVNEVDKTAAQLGHSSPAFIVPSLKPVSAKQLLEEWEFLDGSPCGTQPNPPDPSVAWSDELSRRQAKSTGEHPRAPHPKGRATPAQKDATKVPELEALAEST